MTGVPGRVSVITPCHEEVTWLADAVASVAAQTYPEVEHVVIDDGSTSPAAERAFEAAARAGVRLVRIEHAGVSAARNAGLAAATGEFVWPLDADDLLDPRACQVGVPALRSRPEAAMACPDLLLFGCEQGVLPAEFASVGGFLMQPGFGVPLMRADWVRTVGGYTEHLDYGEDQDLYLKLLDMGPPVLLGDAVYLYRRHQVQATSNHRDLEAPTRAQLMRDHTESFARHAGDFMAALTAERRNAEHWRRRYAVAARLRPW